MLTTRDAIRARRSIRKFRPDPIPDEYITEVLESARLAPSGCNAQPWRFKIVKDAETKLRLAQAAHEQMFIADAPVVIVCCADIKGYIDGSVSGAQDLGKIGAIEDKVVDILVPHANRMKSYPIGQLGPTIAVNVAVAVEHIVLRALDFGLGTCWVRLVDTKRVREIFGWDENMFVFSLLPIGYPAESPQARKRLPLKDIVLSEG